MKIYSFIFIFLTSFSFSQTSVKNEKISFSEYDNLKYIQSLDEDFVFTENIVRYYEKNSSTSYSLSNFTIGNKTVTIIIYPTSTIEYIINNNIANIQYTTTGTLKINGSNKFLTISSCNVEDCTYWIYVNKDEVYKATAKVN